MKKHILVALLAICCMLCACSEIEEESLESVGENKKPDNAAVTTTKAEVTAAAKTTTAAEVTTAATSEGNYDKTEASVPWFFENGQPYERPYDKVSVVGKLSKDTYITEYTSNVLHNEVVGLVGTPFAVLLDGEDAAIRFTMTDKALKSVPLENLIVLWYDEDEYCYEELRTEWDADSNTVSAEITESGVYMLTDWYVWGAAWGADTSEYAHETVFRSEEFGFEVTIPDIITFTETSSAWFQRPLDEEVVSRELVNQENRGELYMKLVAEKFPVSEAPMSLEKKVDRTLNWLASFPSLSSCAKQVYTIDGKDCYLATMEYTDGAVEVAGFYDYSDDIYIELSFWTKRRAFSDDELEKIYEALMSFRYID